MHKSYVSIYTNYSRKRGWGAFDDPPAHNSDKCSYRVNKNCKPQTTCKGRRFLKPYAK